MDLLLRIDLHDLALLLHLLIPLLFTLFRRNASPVAIATQVFEEQDEADYQYDDNAHDGNYDHQLIILVIGSITLTLNATLWSSALHISSLFALILIELLLICYLLVKVHSVIDLYLILREARLAEFWVCRCSCYGFVTLFLVCKVATI